LGNTYGIIRSRKQNDQKKKRQKGNNDLQNTTHKYKDRVTRTPLKPEGELMCSKRIISSYSTTESVFIIRRHLYLTLKQQPHPTPCFCSFVGASWCRTCYDRDTPYIPNIRFWGIVSPIEKIPLGIEIVPKWVNFVQECWRVVLSQCSRMYTWITMLSLIWKQKLNFSGYSCSFCNVIVMFLYFRTQKP
jgi:hypothetical protein